MKRVPSIPSDQDQDEPGDEPFKEGDPEIDYSLYRQLLALPPVAESGIDIYLPIRSLISTARIKSWLIIGAGFVGIVAILVLVWAVHSGILPASKSSSSFVDIGAVSGIAIIFMSASALLIAINFNLRSVILDSWEDRRRVDAAEEVARRIFSDSHR